MKYVNSLISLELSRQPNISEPGVYKEFQMLYNALQLFHAQVSDALGTTIFSAQQVSDVGLQTTARLGAMNVGSVSLTQTVAAGDLINIYDSAGTKGRLADKSAATRRPAHAVALDAGTSGSLIRVCYGGYLAVGTFTAGTRFYLSTSGDYSASQTQVVGEVSQLVGMAVDSTHAIFWPTQPFRVYAYNPQSTATGGLLQDESGVTLYASGQISGVTKYYEPVLVPM